MANIVTQQPPHVLVFPYPAQGHMLALLDLTHQLSLHNLAITILVTPKNLSILNPLLSTHPNIQTLVLPFPSHPKLPPGVENIKDIGNRGNPLMINALSKLQDPIIQWYESHSNPPVAIISDFFLGWTLNLAQKLSIPRISFFSVSALLASIFHSLWKESNSLQSGPFVNFPDIPGSPSFKEEHLPSLYLLCRELNPEAEFVRDGMVANTSSWGVVFNSFNELEGKYLEYLRTKMGHDRVYGVGPLSLIGVTESSDQSNSGSGLDNDVLQWLDGCQEGSVLYVCFGSQKLLNRQQMEALAIGLEKSKTRFIWVVKTGTEQQVKDGYGTVPEGFEDRVSERGLVIKGWVPQVEILKHEAVGGFLTHCGWNSTSEGIVSGVTIMGWPMEADQFVNAKLFAQEMGVACIVCEGSEGVPNWDELAKVIAKSMSQGAGVKERAKELRDKAFVAVKDGGSSLRDLKKFVDQLYMLCETGEK